MPLHDSEAIVLRTYPLAEADRLVSLLTRDHGRLRGVAQGARRPKSRFGAALEPLTYLRVWFYERETRDLVRIRQCEIIESFLDLQQDYRSGLALALAAEITEAVLPEREPQDAAFRLLLHVVRGLRQSRRPELALGYFLVWTLRLAGWLPDLDHASLRSLSAESRAAVRRILAASFSELSSAPNSPGITPQFEAYFLDMIEHHIERRLISRSLYEETR